MIIMCYLRIRVLESILILILKTEKKEEKVAFIVSNMAKKPPQRNDNRLKEIGEEFNK